MKILLLVLPVFKNPLLYLKSQHFIPPFFFKSLIFSLIFRSLIHFGLIFYMVWGQKSTLTFCVWLFSCPSIIFFNLFFNWRIVALQNFVAFCQTASFVEKAVLSPLSSVDIPDKNQLTIDVWVDFWTLSSVGLYAYPCVSATLFFKIYLYIHLFLPALGLCCFM